jgi:hypothetical protein
VRFGSLETLLFRGRYVGLPALDAVEYLNSDNVLGAALAASMRLLAHERAYLRAESLRQIADAWRRDQDQFMLAVRVDRY